MGARKQRFEHRHVCPGGTGVGPTLGQVKGVPFSEGGKVKLHAKFVSGFAKRNQKRWSVRCVFGPQDVAPPRGSCARTLCATKKNQAVNNHRFTVKAYG